MPVSRHFLPWDKPLLPQAVEWLARGWEGKGPLDLGREWVVVPTKQSARRLREALAEFASSKGQAVFAPRVVTPDALIVPAGMNTASRMESLLAWAEVLREAELDAFRDVFPVDPPNRGFSWALRIAERLIAAQSELAGAGLRMGGVADRAGEGFPESERWRQLAELERRYDHKLHRRGRRDLQAARIAAAGDPVAPAGVERVSVVGVSDPNPLALTALGALARTLEVAVVVFVPESEAGSFDEWGRPTASVWSGRVLEFPEFNSRVRLCSDPAAQADEIAELARGYGSPEGLLAVGVADPEVLPELESALGRAGFETFNPEGRARRDEELYHLLEALAAFARDPSFDSVEALARCPAVLEFLGRRMGRGFTIAGWLKGLDELRLRHLAPGLAEARSRASGLRRFPEVGPALDALDELRAELAEGFVEGASGALGRIFEGRLLDPAREDEAALRDGAEAWMGVVRACSAFAPELPVEDAWEIALRLFGEGTGNSDKPEGAVELQGWLELLWEDAPHLVVAGMNEGMVPQAVAGDPFLPESLRENLGLGSNQARLARDAYLAAALAYCRSSAGRLDLLFGKTSGAGEPLRPSRLFLRCEDSELPARVRALFREIDSGRTHLAWHRAWKLAPPVVMAGARANEPEGRSQVELPTRIPVTALRDWLNCPFRFYLRHLLKMEAFDPSKGELDERDFGTLCHGALEAMGRNEGMRECTDPAILRDFLDAELNRSVREQFGENLALPLVLQREAARQRLAKAAEIQAQVRSEGWRIEEVEKKFEVRIGGLVVSGKVDRIERDERSGEARVLDYKTSDKASPPNKAHLQAWRKGDREWMHFDLGKGRSRWADLQLPIYLHGLFPENPQAAACGYFNLPKAVGETGISLWEEYSPQLQDSAIQCAEKVCGAIQGGDFWPPNEEVPPERDPFAALFQHGAAESVAWEGVR